ncbi:hypothetical protein L596_002670 [Steinernema carpocapsae]|uniref:Uncharacterized protein n=1 Tax=Steinernema carpocapsae TaxID=34508 RepID=A0A4U8UQE7_STECR|nr:hypothetical protein L596_002670 [Steinernema carpocapsae]
MRNLCASVPPSPLPNSEVAAATLFGLQSALQPLLNRSSSRFHTDSCRWLQLPSRAFNRRLKRPGAENYC